MLHRNNQEGEGFSITTQSGYCAKIINKLVSTYKTNNPEKLASLMGVDILFLSFNRLSGVLVTLGEHSIIGACNSLDAVRKQLIIAQGLGHLLLHGPGIWPLRESPPRHHKEYQAQLFAISLCVEDSFAKKELLERLA